MQFEALIEPVPGNNPAGNPDITLAPEFQELQVAIEGKPGSQMGDAIIPDQPPEFKRAFTLSTELLAQSKHVALLVALVKSATGLEGLRGLAESIKLFSVFIEQSWDVLHPAADQDDPDDPWWERLALLRELTDGPKMPDALYRATLVEVRHIGAFSLRDIDIANGRLTASDEEVERCNNNLIQGAFTETGTEELLSLNESVEQALDSISQFEKQLLDKTGQIISLDAVGQQVKACSEALQEYAGSRLVESPAEDAVEIDNDTAASSAAVAVVVAGNLNNRDDVIAAFNRIILFYQEHEPSSPVPTLLFRARQMVHKNFFDVLRDLAPQHQDNFRELMKALNVDPLGTLMEHSYNSFLNGETFAVEAMSEQQMDTTPAPEPVVEVAVAQDSGSAIVTETAAVEGDGEQESSIDSSPAAATPTRPASVANTSVAVAAIKNRDEVVTTLNDIQTYFEKNEPSSPVPLVVKKVKTLVTKNFLDLIAEFDVPSENDD